MKHGKWLIGLLALFLVFSTVPAAASAADQVRQETVSGQETEEETEEETEQETEEETAGTQAQAEENPENDPRSFLMHIPFVCAVMVILITGFTIWGKRQEKKAVE